MVLAAPSGLRFWLTVDHRTNDSSLVCGLCEAYCISTRCEPLYPKCNRTVIWDAMALMWIPCNDNAAKCDFGITNDSVSNQRVLMKYTISVALIRLGVINTLTAKPMVCSEAAYGSFLYMPIYYFYFCRIVIILLSWFCLLLLMSFVFRILLKVVSWVLFTQITKCCDRRARIKGHAG